MTQRQRIRTFLAVFVALLLAGCGGGGSDSDGSEQTGEGGSGGSTAETITFTVTDAVGEPITSALLLLHSTENASVTNSFLADWNGEIDVPEDQAEGVYWTLVIPGFGRQQVFTFMDMPLEDTALAFSNGSERTACFEWSATADTAMSFLGSTGVMLSGDNTTDSVSSNVCRRVQDDGTLSELGFSEDETLYGFSLDQPVDDGSVAFDLTLNRAVGERAWRTPTASLQYLSVRGERRGARYNLAPPTAGNSQSGTFPFAEAFPVDRYVILAFTGSFEQGQLLFRKRESLPQEIQLQGTDLSVQNLSYDESAATATWSVSGSADFQAVSTQFRYRSDNMSSVSWTIYQPREATHVTMPPLPDYVENMLFAWDSELNAVETRVISVDGAANHHEVVTAVQSVEGLSAGADMPDLDMAYQRINPAAASTATVSSAP